MTPKTDQTLKKRIWDVMEKSGLYHISKDAVANVEALVDTIAAERSRDAVQKALIDLLWSHDDKGCKDCSSWGICQVATHNTQIDVGWFQFLYGDDWSGKIVKGTKTLQELARLQPTEESTHE